MRRCRGGENGIIYSIDGSVYHIGVCKDTSSTITRINVLTMILQSNRSIHHTNERDIGMNI